MHDSLSCIFFKRGAILFFPIPGIALIISVLQLGTNNFFQGADQICEVLGFSDSVSILRMLFIDSLLLLVQSLLSFMIVLSFKIGINLFVR